MSQPSGDAPNAPGHGTGAADEDRAWGGGGPQIPESYRAVPSVLKALYVVWGPGAIGGQRAGSGQIPMPGGYISIWSPRSAMRKSGTEQALVPGPSVLWLRPRNQDAREWAFTLWDN